MLRFQPAHGDGLALLGKDSEPADEGQFLELDLPFLDAFTLCAMWPDLAQTVSTSSSNLTVDTLFRLSRYAGVRLRVEDLPSELQAPKPPQSPWATSYR